MPARAVLSPGVLSPDGAGAHLDSAPGMRRQTHRRRGHGTAGDICGCGAVFGKTGQAEFPGGSHSWFAGYRGDLALAALIVGGGSSTYAVRMTKVMSDSLPADYLA